MEETIYSIHPYQPRPFNSLNDWTHLPSQTWKNPSLAQSSFHPETPSPLGDCVIIGDGDNLREVFALTRRLLIDKVGPLNDRLVQDDALLEKALGKVHKFLPLPVRLILWKKRYIQFILTNRDRLTP